MNVAFGDFTFRGDTRQLLRADAELHLSPKAFDLLSLLLEARPTAVSKADITEKLWPDVFVTDANLSVLVSEIRAALADDPRTPRFIRTVQRYGYAFCGRVTEPGPPIASSADARSCWLVSGGTRTPVANGASTIGRDPHAEVWLDLPGVSRQHARIVVAGDEATIADLKSKNGTYVRGERIDAAVRVRDGDEIRFGPVAFTFRIWSPATRTATETAALRSARRRRP